MTVAGVVLSTVPFADLITASAEPDPDGMPLGWAEIHEELAEPGIRDDERRRIAEAVAAERKRIYDELVIRVLTSREACSSPDLAAQRIRAANQARIRLARQHRDEYGALLDEEMAELGVPSVARRPS